MNTSVTRLLSLALLLIAVGRCGGRTVVHSPPVIQPGAPGESSRVVEADAAKQPPQATAADIAFMQGMIHHHAQALDMVDLLDARTNDPDMKKLGLRIRVSQTDEIKMMQRWLHARGQDAPDPRAHHEMAGMAGMDHSVMMPGMLNADEMTRLAAAKG